MMWEPLPPREGLDGEGRRWPRPDLRAGDADRQRVVAELQHHYVDGRLSSDELGERVAQATAARTFGELAALLADLPPLDPATGTVVAGTGRAQGGSPRLFGIPPGALLVILGLLAIVWLIVLPSLHVGLLPVWPLFIWGFFFIGRPGRRYH
jgi:hypothetical protein